MAVLQMYLFFAPLMIYNVSDNLSMPEVDSLGLLPLEAQLDYAPNLGDKSVDTPAKKAYFSGN